MSGARHAMPKRRRRPCAARSHRAQVRMVRAASHPLPPPMRRYHLLLAPPLSVARCALRPVASCHRAGPRCDATQPRALTGCTKGRAAARHARSLRRGGSMSGARHAMPKRRRRPCAARSRPLSPRRPPPWRVCRRHPHPRAIRRSPCTQARQARQARPRPPPRPLRRPQTPALHAQHLPRLALPWQP